MRSTNATVEYILANGVGGGTVTSLTSSQISDATTFGRSLMTVASQSAAQSLLGVGAYATITSTQISDASITGKALLVSINAATARGVLGLGTAATTASTAYATATQGAKADTALQPGVLPVGTTIPLAQISDASSTGKSLLRALNPTAAQTVLGLGTAATANLTSLATSTQGGKADTALQPGALPVGTTVTASQISDSSSIGRSLIGVTTQAALQTLVGVTPTTTVTTSQVTDAGATDYVIEDIAIHHRPKSSFINSNHHSDGIQLGMYPGAAVIQRVVIEHDLTNAIFSNSQAIGAGLIIDSTGTSGTNTSTINDVVIVSNNQCLNTQTSCSSINRGLFVAVKEADGTSDRTFVHAFQTTQTLNDCVSGTVGAFSSGEPIYYGAAPTLNSSSTFSE